MDYWKINTKKLYKIKIDKEISFIEKKTNFENFWKLIEVDKPKIISNTANNSINLNKKKKLEIIGLSYCAPSKLNNIQNGKKINKNNKIKELLDTKKKAKKLLTHLHMKIKEKGNEIKSRQEKAKEFNLYSKNNKTEMTINKNNKYDYDDEEVGVPELSPRMRDKENSKINSIYQITFTNLNKLDNNNSNYINKTISSCRNSSKNGSIYLCRSFT